MKERVFIDSNVFVYVLGNDPLFAKKALKHLERVEADEVEAYTSTLVIAQVIAHLARRRRGQAITMFLEYIDSAPIVIASTEWSDYLEAL